MVLATKMQAFHQHSNVHFMHNSIWSLAPRNTSPEICNQRGSFFLCLPNEVHAQILSFLDAGSLCNLGRTCSYMERISSDHLLWHKLLVRDTFQWKSIDHLSHPQVYQEAQSDLHPKVVYQRCYSNHSDILHSTSTSPIVTRIKWFLHRLCAHIPKVLVFGSGLESLPFMRMLMWEKSSPYHPVGLFPGKEGVGSGFCIEHSDGSPINLVTLYTTNEEERQKLANHPRPNRLMTSSDSGLSLTPSIVNLCLKADALLLIVDASVGPIEMDRNVLNAMLQSGYRQTPVLVILAATVSSSTHQPPIYAADTLKLCALANHPWQASGLVLRASALYYDEYEVRVVTLGSFSGLEEGLHWLLNKVT